MPAGGSSRRRSPPSNAGVAAVIALDAHGADGGPSAIATGARLAGPRATLFGPEAELREALAGAGDGFEVVDAPPIDAREEPARAVRARPEGSVVRAAEAVASGRADALVSA